MKLDKTISEYDIFTIALGSIIGWGAFVLPGNKFLPDYGVLNTAIGFVFSVFMIIIIEQSYEIMMKKYTEAGGEYTYVKKTLSPRLGFITGWFLLLAYISIIPLNATAIPLVLERFVGYHKVYLLYTISGFDVYLSDILISSTVVLIFGILNIYGFSKTKKIQKYIVYGLILGTFILGFMALFDLKEEVYQANLKSNLGEVNWNLIIRIIAFAPWAFVGFDNIPQLTEELNFDKKKISRVAILSIVFGALVYNVLNFVTAVGVNKLDLSQAWPTGRAASVFLGNEGLFLIAIALFGAVLSGLNGFFMSSSRLAYSMAKDLIPNSKISKISKYKTPKSALIFIIGVSFLFSLMGREAIFWFVDLSSVGASVAYTLTSLSAFVVSNELKDKIKSSLGVVVGVLFLTFLLTPFWNSNIGEMSAIILAVWIIIGLILSVKTKYNSK